jgi:hypothetical protein
VISFFREGKALLSSGTAERSIGQVQSDPERPNLSELQRVFLIENLLFAIGKLPKIGKDAIISDINKTISWPTEAESDHTEVVAKFAVLSRSSPLFAFYKETRSVVPFSTT